MNFFSPAEPEHVHEEVDDPDDDRSGLEGQAEAAPGI